MSLQDQGAVVVVPRARLAGEYLLDDTYRRCEVGDHIELAGYGWGVVVKISARDSSMTVELFKGRPWIERQPFPEWDMQQQFNEIAERHRKRGADRTDP